MDERDYDDKDESKKKPDLQVKRLHVEGKETGQKSIPAWTLEDSTLDELTQLYTSYPYLGKDGSRVMVLNNDSTIIFCFYDATTSCEFHQKYGKELDRMIFSRIMYYLGFQRGY